ncbi:MAG: 3-phenylpropionate dioxygenase, partial [Acinetobacter sp.]
DRIILENMAPNARQHEFLYQHDVGLSRLRRLMKKEAEKQIKKILVLREVKDENRIEMKEASNG